jgi:hypothetical protein
MNPVSRNIIPGNFQLKVPLLNSSARGRLSLSLQGSLAALEGPVAPGPVAPDPKLCRSPSLSHPSKVHQLPLQEFSQIQVSLLWTGHPLPGVIITLYAGQGGALRCWSDKP